MVLPKMIVANDYQCFDDKLKPMNDRMLAKLEAIPLPDLEGRKVLDVGCDMGFWSFLAKDRGASYVLGIDRNRSVSGVPMDLIANNTEAAKELRLDCKFKKLNLGKQWHELGRFDVIFMFSMYHHVFAQCGDHNPIWFWLSRHLNPGGVVVWENPVDLQDNVVQMNVPGELHDQYNAKAILASASNYFEYAYVGPAKHEPHREVYYFRPAVERVGYAGVATNGAGGATKAFEYDFGRRMNEIKDALGFMPYPGSLNVTLSTDFQWDLGYYRVEMLDVANRSLGLESPWVRKWCRFYPVEVDGAKAYAMRFERENYHKNFVELVSSERLRDRIEHSVTIIQ